MLEESLVVKVLGSLCLCSTAAHEVRRDLYRYPLSWTALHLSHLLLTNSGISSYCQYQQEDSSDFLLSPFAECGWKCGQISEAWAH